MTAGVQQASFPHRAGFKKNCNALFTLISMDQPLQFFLQHGYWVVFATTFVEQIGFPLPAIPVFLMMGFLSRTGHFSIAAVLLLAVLASLLATLIWYALGRFSGRSVLGLVC